MQDMTCNASVSTVIFLLLVSSPYHANIICRVVSKPRLCINWTALRLTALRLTALRLTALWSTPLRLAALRLAALRLPALTPTNRADERL